MMELLFLPANIKITDNERGEEQGKDNMEKITIWANAIPIIKGGENYSAPSVRSTVQ